MTTANPDQKHGSPTSGRRGARPWSRTCSDKSRFLFFLCAAAVTIGCFIASLRDSTFLWGLAVFAPLTAIGTLDLLQHRHTLLRNYPIIGHLRWMLEAIRPQVQQYFVLDDLSGAPFNREQRSIVYARAKGENDFEPFGTETDVYSPGYEWLAHAMTPTAPGVPPRVRIGSPQCTRPYHSALLNVSAMSFGALGARAIEALNRGAAAGEFAHDTGEGGISAQHRHGGDLIWQIGSGYFGCRSADGGFDEGRFGEQATDEQVKMIEIKLSQGAKAGHGGILPGNKVTADIAAARGVMPGEDCVSPARHRTFDSPDELLEFAARLRDLSGGKPVGIKLCIGRPIEFMAICKAMHHSGTWLDFVVIDGKEGGTGAAPEEFSDSVGMPLRDGLLIARNVLTGAGLARHVRLGASGKIVTGFDIARTLAIGADWCNAARPFMFALGCVQSRKCHTGACPTGIATQDMSRQRGLVVADKAARVTRFQVETLRHLMDLVGAAGLSSPYDFRLHHFSQRLDANRIQTLDACYPVLDDGELLDSARDPWYAKQWELASREHF